jgi:hypothetical protein
LKIFLGILFSSILSRWPSQLIQQNYIELLSPLSARVPTNFLILKALNLLIKEWVNWRRSYVFLFLKHYVLASDLLPLLFFLFWIWCHKHPLEFENGSNTFVNKFMLNLLLSSSFNTWSTLHKMAGRAILLRYSHAWPLKIGLKGCLERSVTNYQSRLYNIPEERRSHTVLIFHSSQGLNVQSRKFPKTKLLRLCPQINRYSCLSPSRLWKLLQRRPNSL